MPSTKATIDRFENETAVLNIEDKTINLPKSLLPQDCREGDIINISLTDDANSAGEKKQEAKNILNEILSSNN